MSHCQCEVIERCFDTERVKRELAEYRRHGAASATHLLIEVVNALRSEQVWPSDMSICPHM
jgi:hypothetical protein